MKKQKSRQLLLNSYQVRYLPRATPSSAAITGMGSCSQAPITALPWSNIVIKAALDELCVWADKQGMEYNLKKCKVMHIGHGNTRHVYTMKGQVLDSISEETDVRVHMMDTLKPSAQCHKAAKTAQTVLSPDYARLPFQAHIHALVQAVRTPTLRVCITNMVTLEET